MLRSILSKTTLLGRNTTFQACSIHSHKKLVFTPAFPKLFISHSFSTVPNKKEEAQHTPAQNNPQPKASKEDKENNPKIKKKFHTKKPLHKNTEPPKQQSTGILKCTTVSTAKKYDFNALSAHLRKTYPVTHVTSDTIHISIPSEIGNVERHVFFFEEGLVSAWGLTSEEEDRVLKEIKPFQVLTRKEAYEEEIYFEYKQIHSTLLNDLIIIGTNQNQRDMILDMLAFSLGLARSVKLSLIEQNIDYIVPPLQSLVDELSKTGKLEMSSSSEIELNKKMGEFLGVGSEMYLFEAIVETPEIYWDDSRREDLWDSISYEMEIKARISQSNTKVKQAMEIIRVVQNFQAEQHARNHEDRASRLEWIIIYLILVEVIFGFPVFYRNEIRPFLFGEKPSEKEKEGEGEDNKAKANG